MRQSQLFAKTKKEAPKDAEAVSHKLLTRGDFIEQIATGVYTFLPLGLIVQKKIAQIIREELEKIGAQELLMSALQPKGLWEKTGRWATMDPPLFTLKDRHQKDLALGPTHEEIITYLVSRRIKTFKDLPIALFQIQNKFRNEMRSAGGLLRTREFLMKDLYSFHLDQKDFDKYYELMKNVYQKIFKRCGLKTIITEASGAGFTEGYTHEFQVITPAGEDTIIFCPREHFSKNKEIAKVKAGDKCPKCNCVLRSAKSVEVGNIFPLGTKYSEALDANFIDEKGDKRPIIMGCYGIGIDRLTATIIEIHHDEKGIIWPKSVAPFQVHLIEIQNPRLRQGFGGQAKSKIQKVRKISERLYQDLQKQNLEVLYDDRTDKTPGEKFADADLIGIPTRIVISERTLEKSCVEIKQRDKKKVELVKTNHLLQFLN